MERQPVGIHNMGNTCYINSTLQCMLSCRPFYDYISGQFPPEGMSHNLGELAKAKASVIPRDLLKAMYNAMGKSMNMFEQNDINEFMTLFIDKLNEEVCRPFRKKDLPMAPPYTESAYDQQRMKMDKSWAAANIKDFSPLKDIFYGQLISQIVCGRCGKIHHNYEVFLNIMVPIDGSTSLQQCLSRHLNDEMVNASSDPSENTWRCDRCKECAPSRKTIKLWRLPRVLTVTLKRFTCTGSSLAKVSDTVEIPTSIDMTPYTIGPGEKGYVLKGAAFHSGSFHGGHYFAMCRNTRDSPWYIIDDESVHKTQPEGIERGLSNGYVFFYESLAGP